MLDNINVFMDFTTDEDFNTIWKKRVIEIEGLQMWLQKWSLDFKPEEDLPIAPILVLLPQLPFHMHTWHYVKQIASAIGTPLEMDTATRGRTRPSMAKVRVEVDLLKPVLSSVWVRDEDVNSPLKGFTQKIEYGGVPKYCRHCKKMGHSLIESRVVEKQKLAEKKELERVQMNTADNVTTTKKSDNEAEDTNGVDKIAHKQ